MARLERAWLLARVKHCDGHLRTMAKEHWIAFENIGLPTCCHIHGSHPGIELSIRPTGPNVIALRLRSLTVRAVLHTVIPIITLETTLRCCILLQIALPRCFVFRDPRVFWCVVQTLLCWVFISVDGGWRRPLWKSGWHLNFRLSKLDKGTNPGYVDERRKLLEEEMIGSGGGRYSILAQLSSFSLKQCSKNTAIRIQTSNQTHLSASGFFSWIVFASALLIISSVNLQAGILLVGGLGWRSCSICVDSR